MIDLTTRSVVEDVIRRKVSNDEMFTAWDITREVRNLGHTAYHQDVRNVVQDMFASYQLSGYTRTIHDGDFYAYVYHPANVQPETYVTKTVSGSTSARTAYLSVDDSDDDATNTQAKRQTQIHTRTLDRKGRLRIPAKILRDAGFSPYNVVYVDTDQDGTITISNNGNGRRYAVDTYTNIRLKLPLRGQSAQQYRFTCQQGRVQAVPS